MTAHSTLTGADLHEPKGADTAAAGTIFVADGAGSGSFTVINNSNKVFVSHLIDDISTASSSWILPGVAGTITDIGCVIDGTIATADAGLSFEIGGTPITSGGITVAFSGSAAGDVDTSSPSAANVITATDPIEIITDGASTNTVKATITFIIDIS